jgi:hypothetical protein
MLRLLHGSLERRIKTENARELHFFVLRGAKKRDLQEDIRHARWIDKTKKTDVHTSLVGGVPWNVHGATKRMLPPFIVDKNPFMLASSIFIVIGSPHS